MVFGGKMTSIHSSPFPILRLVPFLWFAVLPHDNHSEGPYTEEQDYCCDAWKNDRVLSRQEILVQFVIAIHKRQDDDPHRVVCKQQETEDNKAQSNCLIHS